MQVDAGPSSDLPEDVEVIVSEESDHGTEPAPFAVATADGGEVTFRGKMVALDEQRAARQFITYRHPGGERRPALRVDVIVDDDGVPWCVSAALTGEPGARRVRTVDVKTVAGQLEALVDGMVASATFIANDQGSGWVKTPPTRRQALPTVRRARKRQRRKTIDLHKVAEVYKNSGPSARTAAVHSAFNVSKRTATRYIQLAREAGLLASTTRGKATDE
jgi:hypothetical protein